MAFEELPADYAKFFETGELPSALAAAEPGSSATVIPDTQVAPEPMHVPEPKVVPVVPVTKVDPVVPVEPVKPAVLDPAPPVPTSNPYLERLLAERDASEAALKKQIEEMQGKLTKLTETPPPDKTTDPLGFMTHQLESLTKQLADMQTGSAETRAQTEQAQQQQAVMNHLNGQVQAFEKEHTDYQAAYKHLVSMRMQDFKDLGLNEQQATQAMENEARGIMQRALATGKNPAELAYGMAKRYGFVAKPAATVENVDNKLEIIKKGMETQTEAQRTTPPSAKDLTVDNLKNMSDRELNKVVDKEWESLFGMKKGIFQ